MLPNQFLLGDTLSQSSKTPTLAAREGLTLALDVLLISTAPPIDEEGNSQVVLTFQVWVYPTMLATPPWLVVQQKWRPPPRPPGYLAGYFAIP